MTIHKEGYKPIMISLVASIILMLLFHAIIPIFANWHWLFYGGLFMMFLWIVLFFRMPSRVLTINPDLVISPADGKVVVVENTYEEEYFKKPMLQVSVFMSPLNVHVNRYPVAGHVLYKKYHPGKFLVAWHPKSSTLNERMSIAMHMASKREIMIRQIAGILARRIICYSVENQKTKQGQELGFIRFGSRVDVFMPLDSKVLVKPGDHVKGGVTPIADLKA